MGSQITRMKEVTPVIFQPFMKFVIEFHNDITLYGSILKNEFPKVSALQNEDIVLLEESYLIKVVAEWESFTHNIIAYCIAIDTTAMSKHLELNLPKKISFDNAYSILNGLQYKTITSSNELKSLTRKILTDQYNPFLQFEKSTLNSIDDLYSLRNYIAHKSQRARERLLTMYRNRYAKISFVEPGYFLTEPNELGSKITRRDLLYGKLLFMTLEIWKFLDKDSYIFVYDDDTTEEGMLKGLAKMQSVFHYLT